MQGATYLAALLPSGAYRFFVHIDLALKTKGATDGTRREIEHESVARRVVCPVTQGSEFYHAACNAFGIARALGIEVRVRRPDNHVGQGRANLPRCAGLTVEVFSGISDLREVLDQLVHGVSFREK